MNLKHVNTDPPHCQGELPDATALFRLQGRHDGEEISGEDAADNSGSEQAVPQSALL